jgi:RNase H-fold protein (predicted Holliday junction resolvase)
LKQLADRPEVPQPEAGAVRIRVVDEILSTGDAAHGVQTAAYNLPNDDRVVQKGSKRVMLKTFRKQNLRAF